MRFLRTLSLIALILSCPLVATSEQIQWGVEFSEYAREAKFRVVDLAQDRSLLLSGLETESFDHVICEMHIHGLLGAIDQLSAVVSVSGIMVTCGCKHKVAWVNLGEHLGYARTVSRSIQEYLGTIENRILADQAYEDKKYLDSVITTLENSIPSKYRGIVSERMKEVLRR